MKVVKNVIRTATLLGACAMFLLSNPINSYAWGCSYSHSVWDPIGERDVWATHWLDPYSNDVYTNTSTTAAASISENINVRGGWVNGTYYDYYDNCYLGCIHREEVDGQSPTTSSAQYFDVDMDINQVKGDFGVCSSGNWNWTNGYWQTVN